MDSKLAGMFGGRDYVLQDRQGRYFIDRDGKLFHHILTYLRHDKLPPPDLAVDVLEEAEYYQLKGLVDWCKTQAPVISQEIVALAEREEQQLRCQLLTHEFLAKLAKQSIEGELSSLFENGVNGSLVGKVGVVFASRNFKAGEESRSFVEECNSEKGFDTSAETIWIGPDLMHRCIVGPKACKPVSLVIHTDDVINPVVYVQRAVQRFNRFNPRLQLELERFTEDRDVIAQKTTCGRLCERDVYYFGFKFLLPATPIPAGSSPEVSST